MKRPTQVDVAQLAGVSRATVSYVVNGHAAGRISITAETRQRVQTAIDTLGYQPDARGRSLRSGGTGIIGLLIPDLHNPHYWAIAQGVETVAQQAGYQLLLSSTSLEPERELQTLQALSSRRIDGLILLLSFLGQSNQVLTKLAKHHYPVVVLGAEAQALDTVITTYREGTQHLLNHLLGLGHQRIGFIFGVASPDLGKNRLNIYRQTLLEAGLPYHEALVDRCGTTLEDGYQAARRLLAQQPRPTALLAINDLLSIGALRAANELGIQVPTQLSLVSFDDIEMAAYLNPPLTSVRANASDLGCAAAKLVLARLADPQRTFEQVHIPAKIMMRASTGPASVP
jgi:LacI family transcriptional regulator